MSFDDVVIIRRYLAGFLLCCAFFVPPSPHPTRQFGQTSCTLTVFAHHWVLLVAHCIMTGIFCQVHQRAEFRAQTCTASNLFLVPLHSVFRVQCRVKCKKIRSLQIFLVSNLLLLLLFLL